MEELIDNDVLSTDYTVDNSSFDFEDSFTLENDSLFFDNTIGKEEILGQGTMDLSADNPTIFDTTCTLNDLGDKFEGTMLGKWAAQMADHFSKESSAEMADIKSAIEHSADFFNRTAPHLYQSDDGPHFSWSGDNDYMIGGNPQSLEMMGLNSADATEFTFAHETVHYLQHIQPIEGISDNSKLNEMTSDFGAAFKSGAEGRSVDDVKDFLVSTGSNPNYPDGEIRAQIVELGHSLGNKYLWKDFQSVSEEPNFSLHSITDVVSEFKNIDESQWGQKVAELQDKVDNIPSFTLKL